MGGRRHFNIEGNTCAPEVPHIVAVRAYTPKGVRPRENCFQGRRKGIAEASLGAYSTLRRFKMHSHGEFHVASWAGMNTLTGAKRLCRGKTGCI